MFTPRTLIASSSLTSTLRLPCRGTFVFTIVCLIFTCIFPTGAAFWLSQVAFSISLSSLFVVLDPGLLPFSMISRVSSKENLLLIFVRKLFSISSSTETPLLLLIADLLSCSREFDILLFFALVLDFFCPPLF